MKIAILTSGILPVPAVQGGAVENLIDFYLEYNDCHKLHDITVYSVWHPDAEKHLALKSQANHYEYIDTNSLKAKVVKRIYKWMHRDGYYFYTIEYFIDQVLSRIRKQEFDIILIENRPGYALKLTGMTDAKLVYHLHNGKLDNTVKAYQDIYDAATRIITVSDYITKCVKTINSEDQKTITIHNGINLKAFNSNFPPRIQRKDLELQEADFVLLFTGRIAPEKGLLELLTAMMQLKAYPRIKLINASDPFYGIKAKGGPYLDKIQAILPAVGKQVISTGFIPYELIPSYLQLTDVAVIPSIWNEPFGLTVAEAQAMGKPIITTRMGGIPEVVSEENAILLDTDEHFIDNLAAAILDLYQHPEKRSKMAAASIARSRMFDKDTYARNFFKALEEI